MSSSVKLPRSSVLQEVSLTSGVSRVFFGSKIISKTDITYGTHGSSQSRERQNGDAVAALHVTLITQARLFIANAEHRTTSQRFLDPVARLFPFFPGNTVIVSSPSHGDLTLRLLRNSP